jgi:hypothetical protein
MKKIDIQPGDLIYLRNKNLGIRGVTRISGYYIVRAIEEDCYFILDRSCVKGHKGQHYASCIATSPYYTVIKV